MFVKRMKYSIKTCSLENPQDLQDLLNEMSENGWELYSMQEDENEEGHLLCHCIFMRPADNEISDSDFINVSSFKNRMEKMLSSEQSPYNVCLDIQSKIRDRKHKISEIKKELEGEAPASVMRKKLNDKISASLKELDDLKIQLSKTTSSAGLFSKLKEDKLALCLSEELLEYVENNSGLADEELVAEIVKSRLDLVDDLGYVVPRLVIKDDMALNPFEFSIKVRGLDVFKAFVYPNYLMFFEDELHLGNKEKDAIYDIDGITKRKTVWIARDKAKDYWCKGVSGAQYIANALKYCAIKYVKDIFDYEELEKYLDVVRQSNEFLIENLIPEQLNFADIKSILSSLIGENVSIKDIVYIFEKMNDLTSDVDKEDLLDNLRLALAKHICKRYVNPDGVISAYELTDETLIKLSPFIYQDDDDGETDEIPENILKFDKYYVQSFITKLQKKIKNNGTDNPILLVPMDYRTIIRTILEKLVDVTVLAMEEVQISNVKLDIIGKI